jgi:hypothetical protein
MQPSCPGSRDLNWTGKGLIIGFLCTLQHFGKQNVVYYESYYFAEHITDLQVGGEKVSWNVTAQER